MFFLLIEIFVSFSYNMNVVSDLMGSANTGTMDSGWPALSQNFLSQTRHSDSSNNCQCIVAPGYSLFAFKDEYSLYLEFRSSVFGYSGLGKHFPVIHLIVFNLCCVRRQIAADPIKFFHSFIRYSPTTESLAPPSAGALFISPYFYFYRNKTTTSRFLLTINSVTTIKY